MRPRDYLRRQQDGARRSLARHRDRFWARVAGSAPGAGSSPAWPRYLAWGAGGLALGLASGVAFGAMGRGAALAARGMGRLARVALTTGLTRVLSG